MEPPEVSEFKTQILSGQPFSAPLITTLTAKLFDKGILAAEKRQSIEFLMFEQMYLELMDKGSTIDAVKLLQAELRPRCTDQHKLHSLA